MHTQCNLTLDSNEGFSDCNHADEFYPTNLSKKKKTNLLKSSVSNINEHIKTDVLDQENFPIQIFTLGRFSLLHATDSVRFSGKGQRKSLELLKTLIAFGGRDVGETRLNEALWAESDGDVAHTAFAVTLHRLRKFIGSETLILSDGRLTLNPALCWVDSWSCQRLIGQIKNNLNQRPIEHEKLIKQTNELVSRYHGPFLGNEDEQPWFLSYRQRLHNKFLGSIFSVGSYLEQSGHCDLAIDLYENALVIDDLSERSYLKLMRCYCKIGHNSEALKVYQRCKKLLMAHLGVEPCAETVALYNSLNACA
jgi:LuxR family maltose regulon positive regulatory protein